VASCAAISALIWVGVGTVMDSAAIFAATCAVDAAAST
jgi:hypothetical protein